MIAPFASGAAFSLYRADAFKILPEFADNSVGFALMDPPWHARTHAGARTLAGGEPAPLVNFAPISEAELRRTLAECGRLCPRWTLAFADWRHLGALDVLPPEHLSFDTFAIWTKPNSAPAFDGRGPVPGWEAIGIFHRAGVARRWNGGGRRGVFSYNVERGPHPCTKPQPLLRELITLFSEPGDLVLDPFAGSGSVGVAALATGRRYLGIEIDEHWCAVSAQRLAAADAQGSLFEPAALIKPKQLAIADYTPREVLARQRGESSDSEPGT